MTGPRPPVSSAPTRSWSRSATARRPPISPSPSRSSPSRTIHRRSSPPFPPSTAVVNQAYAYTASGSDADGDPLVWSIVSGPTGLGIDPDLGTIVWTPTSDQAGHTYPVTIKADDGQGGWATTTFNILAQGADLPPQFVSVADLRAATGVDWQYQALAIDPEGDTPTYGLVSPPGGMTISAAGLIDWPDPTGSVTDFQVTATDGQGLTTTQDVPLQIVATAPIAPPVITSTPVLTAIIGSAYEYTVTATDPGGLLPLSYGLISNNTGSPMSFNGNVLTWNPSSYFDTPGQSYGVSITVTNSAGAAAEQDFQVYLTNANSAPTIPPIATQNITAGTLLTIPVQASDTDGDSLTYAVSSSPPITGLTIDSAGTLSWTPDPTYTGSPTITVTATDSYGLAATTSFSVNVAADTTPPQVQVHESANPADVNSLVVFHVDASDNVGIKTLSLTVGGTNVPLDAHGDGRLLMAAIASNIPIVATATDLAGLTSQATDSLNVINPADSSAPTATISSPTDQATITAPVPVIGTVSDAVQVQSWRSKSPH